MAFVNKIGRQPGASKIGKIIVSKEPANVPELSAV
jgi:hypothetical protein